MIIGKDLYAAFATCEQEDGWPTETWEDLRPKARQMYERAAAKLNTSHIIPLQGVVRTFIELLEDESIALIVSDTWEDKKEAAVACAKELLNEENESCNQ